MKSKKGTYHNSGWQAGCFIHLFLRKQCVNKRFQLWVFNEFYKKYKIHNYMIFNQY